MITCPECGQRAQRIFYDWNTDRLHIAEHGDCPIRVIAGGIGGRY
jgi:hypothetical protein